jgi:separase
LVTAEQLANELATKLTIGNVNGKGKEKEKAEEGETKLLSMRSVNAASQVLTQVVQSGWKKSSPDASKTTLSSVSSSASAAAKGLSNLRKICPGDLDVERAASSVLGKLIALEMVCPKFISSNLHLILSSSIQPTKLFLKYTPEYVN